MQQNLFGSDEDLIPVTNRSPLWYIGGKVKLFPLVKALLPVNTKKIVSPFIGGGALEIQIASHDIEVYAFDVFAPLVNFYNCMKTDAARVVNGMYRYMPLADKYYDTYDNFPKHKVYTELDFDDASAFWALNRGSYSGCTLAMRGTTHNADIKSPQSTFFDQWKNFHVPKLHVSCANFQTSLQMYPDIFAYLDPPYVDKENLYGDNRTGKRLFDHVLLYEMLDERQTPWILSYQKHNLIIELYSNYDIITLDWRYSCQPAGDNPDGTEILIKNF